MALYLKGMVEWRRRPLRVMCTVPTRLLMKSDSRPGAGRLLLGLCLLIFVVSCSAESLPPTPGQTGAEPGSTQAAQTTGITGAPAPTNAEPARADPLVVVAGGDVNLGRQAGQNIIKNPQYNPFGQLAASLRSADLAFVNLESPLSDQGGQTQSPHAALVFTGPPGGAETLVQAGIDVVSFANNHSWDYGKPALFQTLANLQRVGIPYPGASRTPGQQYRPAVVQVRGWSVAIFAVTHIWNLGPFYKHEGQRHVAWANFARLKKRLAVARKKHDIVLISYHGGGEYLNLPLGAARHFATQVMQAGADAFIGHHPHVPQGARWVGDRPVFYSLGNLVFGKRSDHRWERTSFIVRMRFGINGSLRVQACPYDLTGTGHVPSWLGGVNRESKAEEFRRHLRKISKPVGGTDVGELDKTGCLPLRPPKSSR